MRLAGGCSGCARHVELSSPPTNDAVVDHMSQLARVWSSSFSNCHSRHLPGCAATLRSCLEHACVCDTPPPSVRRTAAHNTPPAHTPVPGLTRVGGGAMKYTLMKYRYTLFDDERVYT